MKDKMINFLKERKELFIFVGIVMLIFATVITIAELTSNDISEVGKTTATTNNPTQTSSRPTSSSTKTNIKETMMRPLAGDQFVINRYFFDLADVANLEDSVIKTGNVYENSRGVSYGLESSEAFNVIAVFSGNVTFVDNDELLGGIVEITHENGLISRYSSLSQINVIVGDQVDISETIGVSGEYEYDLDAKNHVHLQLIYNGKFINSLNCYGKTLEEIIASM